MNPQDPLANLAPLREPELVSWWPLAPGWWLLLVLCIASLAALCWWAWRRHQRSAYRRQALAQLATLMAQYDGDITYLREANALLKSVALSAYPAADVAAKHSDDWERFLNSTVKPGQSFAPGFSSAAYSNAPTAVDAHAVHRSAQYWIKHHRVSA